MTLQNVNVIFKIYKIIMKFIEWIIASGQEDLYEMLLENSENSEDENQRQKALDDIELLKENYKQFKNINFKELN